jgi:hypothetical protein
MLNIKRGLWILCGLAVLTATATAQDTSGGTLTVTATVDSSISLTFENDASGVSLSGAGTSAATLAFGAVSAYETISTSGISRSVNGTTNYTISSPFGVKVVKANSASAAYTLAAALSSADANNTWKIGSTTLSTTSATVASTQSYGSAVSHTLNLTITHALAAGAVSNGLNFTATAN